MEFPQQITSILVVRDSNGNIIIQAGPNPSLRIQSPFSQAAIEMLLDSPGSIPEILFTNTTGAHRYRIQQVDSLLAIEKVPQTSGPAIYLDDNPGGGLNLYSEVGSARGIHLDDSLGFAYHVTPSVGAEGWTTLPLTAGYSGINSVDYKLLPDGTVILRGTILAPVSPIPAGTVIATLPAGYRIAQDALMGIVFDSSAVQGRIVIRAATGNIECYDAPNGRPSMDGIQFSTI